MNAFVDGCFSRFLHFYLAMKQACQAYLMHFLWHQNCFSLYLQGLPGVSGAGGLEGEVGDTVNPAPFFSTIRVCLYCVINYIFQNMQYKKIDQKKSLASDLYWNSNVGFLVLCRSTAIVMIDLTMVNS